MMGIRHILLGLSLGSIVTPALAREPAPGGASELVYVGTQGSGAGQGIFAARLDVHTGRLAPLGVAAEVARPTWTLTNPAGSALYSVSEVGNDGKSQAAVFSFAVDHATGGLRLINNVDSGGGGATHLAIDPQSQTIFVANFGGGQVSALPIEPGGGLAAAASVQTDVGSGPSPRQKGPHAHGVTVDPTHQFLLVPDLGADRVFIYRFDPQSRQLTPADPPSEAVPPGSGPRHLVFHPNGSLAFLLSELSAELRVYRWDAAHGRLALLQTTSIDSPGFAGQKSGAEIAISPDGNHLYVSNRGEDSIVSYSVDATTGSVREIQRIPAQGKLPWSFSIDPTGRWMLVANRDSNAVAELKIDPKTGMLSSTQESLSIPTPVNVTFVRN